jgi:hypothetical protein
MKPSVKAEGAMKQLRLLAVSTLAATLCLGAAATAGTANRAWVSGKGVDQAGCGAPTAPCRSFQYVHDNIVAAGGEIDVLDPAGYGAITITKSLSIVNDGVGVAGVQATAFPNDAIQINAGPSDTIFLKGLSIDGLNAGFAGIVFNTGGNISIVDCLVRRFADRGIIIEAPAGPMSFLISNTLVADNGVSGVSIVATGPSLVMNGSVDHVTVVDNGTGGGEGIETDLEPGGGNISLTFSNDVVSNNGYGFYNSRFVSNLPTTAEILIQNSTIDDNLLDGLVDGGNGNLRLSRSAFNGNGEYGVLSSPNTGLVYSYGDNTIDGNLSGAVSGVLTPDSTH